MARDFIRSSSDVIIVESPAATGPPMTMSLWFYVPEGRFETGLADAMFLGDGSHNSRYYTLTVSAGGGGRIGGSSRHGSTTIGLYADGNWSRDVWHHAAAVFTAAGPNVTITAYLDGAGKVTHTGPALPPDINRTAIGAQARASMGLHFDGLIAEAAIWSTAFTDDEIIELARGRSPRAMTARINDLAFHQPLLHDVNDWLTGPPMAGDSSPAATHPPIRLAPMPAVAVDASPVAAASSVAAIFHPASLHAAVFASRVIHPGDQPVRSPSPMTYKPGDTLYAHFATHAFDTGQLTAADATPSAALCRNGIDDEAVALTVTSPTTGRYVVTGAIPETYAAGDVIQIVAHAAVDSVSAAAVIDSFVLDAARHADLIANQLADLRTLLQSGKQR